MLQNKSKKQEVPFLYLYVFKLMTEKIGMADQLVTTKELLELKLSQSENSAQNRTLADDVPPHY